MNRTAQVSTFAGQLKHFAQSVNFVEKRTFDQVRSLVVRYTKELDADYFELVQAECADDNSGDTRLRTFWSSHEKFHAWPIKNAQDQYTNPITQSFAARKPLWIVAKDKSDLSCTDQYLDLWSAPGTPIDFPRFSPSSPAAIKTLVVVPLVTRSEFASYYLESPKYIEATDVAKLELQRMAEALGILYSIFQNDNAQACCRERALDDLQDQLDRSRFPKLAKPHLFLAFSDRADETVTLLIKKVMAEFSNRLEVRDWTKMEGSGSIPAQIAREIIESRFGLCYLSEPYHDEGPHPTKYFDNPNVLFEAGMVHARTSASADDSSGEPTGWIPIREPDCARTPFDFAADRILIVPRTAGTLNESRFEEMLRQRLEQLLNES